MHIMKILEYDMVTAAAYDIAEKINAAIRRGWQPFGSPTVLPSPEGEGEQVSTAFQAIVRSE
jgi:hypothetical protein